MGRAVHIGIEYADFGPRIAVLIDGVLHSIALLPDPADDLILVDSQPPRKLSGLGIAFPTLLDAIGRPEIKNHDLVGALLRVIYDNIERKAGKQSGRAIFAIPMGLTSGRRSALVARAQEAGFSDIELVDASIPSGMVFSSDNERPTTQLVYHLGYGDCEYALLRVVRGRVKVLDSGVADGLSGQLIDLQIMEAIVLALRAHNVFLGLKSFRAKQWLQFRRIVAKAREDLARKPVVEILLPPNLVSNTGSIRITLSAAGLVARFGPVIKNTIDDLIALLERNDVKREEIDAVIALGDTATRPPVAAFLAHAFPGKVMIGDLGTVAAASAVYSAWLERLPNGADLGIDLSHYLSPYEGPELSLDQPQSDGADPPLISGILVEEIASPAAPTPPGTSASARDQPPPKMSDADAAVRGRSAADTAKELIEQRRYPEAIAVLQRLASESKDTRPPPEASSNAPEVLMLQAESFQERGLYMEAVALSHQAYEESGRQGELFARMLGVHIKAAAALSEPEQYDDAIRILMCAHTHDQTDRGVHQALAARHYGHALAMHAAADDAAAREAVLEALRFDPKSPQALALSDELNRTPAPPA